MDTQFSLRWNNYANQLTDALGTLLHREDLVDVTLSCEGKKIRAHKMLLSACSPYFHDIFKENLCQHPVIVFQNVQFVDLKAIIEYIYCGEVNVLQGQLESFLNTAEMLYVKGLSEKGNENEVEEYLSGPSEINKGRENVQIDVVEEQQINKVLRKKLSVSPKMAGSSSPPSKRKKTNEENPPDVAPVPNKVTTVKVEKEDIDIVDVEDVNVTKSEVSELFTQQVSSPRPKSLQQRNVAESSETLQDIDKNINDPLTEEALEEIANVKDEDKRVHSQEPLSPDVISVEPNTASVHLKKRMNNSEEEISLESEIPAVPCKKHDDVSLIKKSAQPVKSPTKCKVQIPKGLIVTPIQSVQKVKELFDFPKTQESQLVPQEEAYVALRSEDATTPVHEEPILHSTSQELQMYDNPPSQQIPEGEPEVAKEAPVLEEEQTEPDSPVEEVPKEPEFDYFGCEICKGEAKPVDTERITFNQKCPICPCVYFCSHLLKEHMKITHGWFNVQRRFTHY